MAAIIARSCADLIDDYAETGSLSSQDLLSSLVKEFVAQDFDRWSPAFGPYPRQNQWSRFAMQEIKLRFRYLNDADTQRFLDHSRRYAVISALVSHLSSYALQDLALVAMEKEPGISETRSFAVRRKLIFERLNGKWGLRLLPSQIEVATLFSLAHQCLPAPPL